jgi:hypothetical protein
MSSQEGETKLANMFAERGYTVTTTQDKGKFSGYDLAVERDGLSITIEYKHDIKSELTGNWCCELYKDVNGSIMNSGLSATEADLYVQRLGLIDENMYGIKVRDLRAYIDLNQRRLKFVRGGDGYRSQLVLMPVEEFKSIATILFQTPIN